MAITVNALSRLRDSTCLGVNLTGRRIRSGLHLCHGSYLGNRRAYATGSSPSPSSAAACVGVRWSTSKRVSSEVTSRDKVCSVVMPTSMCPSRSACAKALPDPTSEIVAPGADAVPALRGRAAGQNGLRAVPEAGDCSVPNVEQF